MALSVPSPVARGWEIRVIKRFDDDSWLCYDTMLRGRMIYSNAQLRTIKAKIVVYTR